MGRGGGVVLMQIVRDHCGIDAAIFDLHRHLVFVMHHQRVKDAGAFRDAERRRLNMIRPGLLKQEYLTAVLMVTGDNFCGNTAHLEQRRLPFRLGDKVPTPCNLTSRPSSVSSRSARLMVIRLKPNWATSSASDGIRSCGRQTPLWIFFADRLLHLS